MCTILANADGSYRAYTEQEELSNAPLARSIRTNCRLLFYVPQWSQVDATYSPGALSPPTIGIKTAGQSRRGNGEQSSVGRSSFVRMRIPNGSLRIRISTISELGI